MRAAFVALELLFLAQADYAVCANLYALLFLRA